MPRLCVLPADPIGAYIAKGEIKERYFNPLDLFEEVHLVTADSGPVDADALRRVAGSARVVLHPLGPWRARSLAANPYVGTYPRRLVERVMSIAPDVIRAYTPVEVGWLARRAARAIDAPYVVSVHGNYDLDIRGRLRSQRRWRGYLYYILTAFIVEPRVLRDAAAVICAYEFAARYVRRLRSDGVEVIYNRVSLDAFGRSQRGEEFVVLFVGRCEENKGQDLLIRAMTQAPGRLVLVGDGPTRPSLEALAERLGLGGRVTFVRAVPHAAMPDLYAKASCYASAILYGGIQIPHLEAMASGLPLVVAQPLWEESPEQLGDVALVAPRSPAGVAAALTRVAEEPHLAAQLSARSLERARELRGERMEQREADLYRRMLASSSRRATTR